MRVAILTPLQTAMILHGVIETTSEEVYENSVDLFDTGDLPGAKLLLTYHVDLGDNDCLYLPSFYWHQFQPISK